MANHPVSDLITRIRNGYLADRAKIASPASKLRENILHLLKEEGFILNYSKVKGEDGHERFDIHLKYHNEKPVISEIEVISKPGRRLYSSCDDIPVVYNGLGLVVLSTSKGVVADHEARERKIGGELLLKVF